MKVFCFGIVLVGLIVVMGCDATSKVPAQKDVQTGREKFQAFLDHQDRLYFDTALIKGVNAKGNVKCAIVQALVDAGARSNIRNKFQKSPLSPFLESRSSVIYSGFDNVSSIISLLLRNYPHMVFDCPDYRYSPLFYYLKAVSPIDKGFPGILDEYCKNKNLSDAQVRLKSLMIQTTWRSYSDSQLKELKRFFNKNQDINVNFVMNYALFCDEGNQSYGVPLIYLIKELSMSQQQAGCDLITLFLERGADVDSCDSEGYSALHCAIWKNLYKVAELLVDWGANVVLGKEFAIESLYEKMRDVLQEIAKLNDNAQILLKKNEFEQMNKLMQKMIPLVDEKHEAIKRLKTFCAEAENSLSKNQNLQQEVKTFLKKYPYAIDFYPFGQGSLYLKKHC